MGSCFGATSPCSSDPSLVPPSLVSPCGATTRLTNSVILTLPSTPTLATLWKRSRVICSGWPLKSSPWVLPSWNPMKAGMAQFMALPEESQKAWMEAHMKEEMMKKEHMMMKAKELGIEMEGEKSEWSESDKEDMDWEEKEMVEEM